MMDVSKLGDESQWFVIAGPCVIEGYDFLMQSAETLKKITDKYKVPLIFKSSYDKANRTSIASFRGPGIEEGLKMLRSVRQAFDIPTLTDVHHLDEVERAAQAVDVLQIPAFLIRQTDLVLKAGQYAKVVNLKKAQFMAPSEMAKVVEKLKSIHQQNIWLTERGTMFGYNNLVVDFRSIPEMKKNKLPVIFDGTHSVQQPGALGTSTGGTREHIPYLIRAAVAVGVDGLFMEVHPQPEQAKSDAATQLSFETFERVLDQSLKIREALFLTKNKQ